MKNWKQFTFVAIIAIVGIIIGFMACDNNGNETTHVHQWGDWTVTTAPTCTTEGVQTRVCTLDATHTETRPIAIDPNAHLWGNWIVTTPATTTEEGIETRACEHNSAHKETRPIDKLTHVHQWGDWTVITAPTCTTEGEETRACTICSEKETHTIVALGHNYTWVTTTDPTCTTSGIETGTCTHDGSTTTRTIAELGHNWEWIVTGEGVETETCRRCAITNGIRLTYDLGDTGPGGGKIFYVSEIGFTMTINNQVGHYLEAAPNNMTSDLFWASSERTNTDIAGTSTTIGTGRYNTIYIQSLSQDPNAPAAKACMEYNGGGKTDWFLPSKDELNELYKNRDSVGNMGVYYYWSSSQYDNTRAWSQLFDNGTQYVNFKNNPGCNVRAVRAF